jgi:DNA-binding LacI/PurR family transcriptional regulator
MQELGRRAVELLLERITFPATPRSVAPAFDYSRVLRDECVSQIEIKLGLVQK